MVTKNPSQYLGFFNNLKLSFFQGIKSFARIFLINKSDLRLDKFAIEEKQNLLICINRFLNTFSQPNNNNDYFVDLGDYLLDLNQINLVSFDYSKCTLILILFDGTDLRIRNRKIMFNLYILILANKINYFSFNNKNKEERSKAIKIILLP